MNTCQNSQPIFEEMSDEQQVSVALPCRNEFGHDLVATSTSQQKSGKTVWLNTREKHEAKIAESSGSTDNGTTAIAAHQ